MKVVNTSHSILPLYIRELDIRNITVRVSLHFTIAISMAFRKISSIKQAIGPFFQLSPLISDSARSHLASYSKHPILTLASKEHHSIQYYFYVVIS